ncbi:NlpC/P60 family protein [Citromicrobium sp. JLT1363]|uniref:NlpC/P60 family protein n=1 Tax=Citromicrobium sp. JLT1363 TaxID=517722 RepID=UPI000225E6EE|nr:NlpC/P60 family protein [Citromicrobium sp. JLT1363]
MTPRIRAVIAAANGLAGTPFRLQGRDPDTGLDCIGVILISLDRAGIRPRLPEDYRPHRRAPAIPESALAAAGLARVDGDLRQPGDILLLRTAPAQMHAAIAVEGSDIVHAHAGARRVVRGALPDHWSIIAAWRLHPDGEYEWQR